MECVGHASRGMHGVEGVRQVMGEWFCRDCYEGRDPVPQPETRGRKVGDNRRGIVKAYLDGCKVSEIGRMFHLSERGVRYHLEAEGLRLR